jgi:hypothetical protein
MCSPDRRHPPALSYTREAPLGKKGPLPQVEAAVPEQNSVVSLPLDQPTAPSIVLRLEQSPGDVNPTRCRLDDPVETPRTKTAAWSARVPPSWLVFSPTGRSSKNTITLGWPGPPKPSSAGQYCARQVNAERRPVQSRAVPEIPVRSSLWGSVAGAPENSAMALKRFAKYRHMNTDSVVRGGVVISRSSEDPVSHFLLVLVDFPGVPQ